MKPQQRKNPLEAWVFSFYPFSFGILINDFGNFVLQGINLKKLNFFILTSCHQKCNKTKTYHPPYKISYSKYFSFFIFYSRLTLHRAWEFSLSFLLEFCAWVFSSLTVSVKFNCQMYCIFSRSCVATLIARLSTCFCHYVITWLRTRQQVMVPYLTKVRLLEHGLKSKYV